MANLAYQVTNFAYQGSGVFVYQGSEDGGVVVQPAGFNLRPKRVRRKKRYVTEEIEKQVIVEVPEKALLPQGTLAQILKDMERAGFDIIDQEEEDEALVLTFILKSLH